MGTEAQTGKRFTPRFDLKTHRWRATDGRFMKLGVPVNGWVLVRCEACGQHFPTMAWHPSEKRPEHYFCTKKCWRSGKVADVIPEIERDGDIVRRYQRGEPLAAIQEAYRISTGGIFRILHRHGVKSNRTSSASPRRSDG